MHLIALAIPPAPNFAHLREHVRTHVSASWRQRRAIATFLNDASDDGALVLLARQWSSGKAHGFPFVMKVEEQMRAAGVILSDRQVRQVARAVTAWDERHPAMKLNRQIEEAAYAHA